MKTKKFNIYTPIEPIDIIQNVVYCDGEEQVHCVELRFDAFNEPKNIVIEDINKLKRQLAEKHKEIERLTKYASVMTVYNPTQKAIEELEKVKDDIFVNVELDNEEQWEIIKLIVDNRIKELKGGNLWHIKK